MDTDKINNWSFAGGFDEARQAGFSEEEMRQLSLRWEQLCDKVLVSRVRDVPKDIRDLIDWSARINYPVPCRPPDITPDRCYFILPVRYGENSEENQVLLLSPTPGQWALTTCRHSSNFIDWLTAKGDAFASGWIDMMIGEFGLRDDMLGAWVTPAADGRMLDIRLHAQFWRELGAASRKELMERLVNAAAWMNGMGAHKITRNSEFLAIPPSDIDYDPERTTFAIPFMLVTKECCLLFTPERKIPILLQESLGDIKLRLKGTTLDEQHAWLSELLEE